MPPFKNSCCLLVRKLCLEGERFLIADETEALVELVDEADGAELEALAAFGTAEAAGLEGAKSAPNREKPVLSALLSLVLLLLCFIWRCMHIPRQKHTSDLLWAHAGE
jgi:hypothetical protein